MGDFMKSKIGINITCRQIDSRCYYSKGRKRRSCTAGLFLFLVMLSIMFFPDDSIYAQEIEFKECSVAGIRSVSQLREIGAGYTEETSASYKDDSVFYFSFTLETDAWVYFSGSYSQCRHDGAGTHVNIYRDCAMSSRAGGYGWGYWEHDNVYTGFLEAGTYYAEAVTKQENYQGDFIGNVNITAAAVSVKDIFDFDVEASYDWQSAEVSVSDTLGSFVKNVQYQKGSLSIENVYGRKYWKRQLMDDYYSSSPEGAGFLYAADGKYSFQAAANGYYTVMVEDMSGSRYSAAVRVSEIDHGKPKVSGVKNGKTYKKAVRIKFSDSRSGICKAELNGKKISSGKKISADGSYSLAVYDRAGNKTEVMFRIKR